MMPRPEDFTGVIHTWFEREGMFLMDDFNEIAYDKFQHELTLEELDEERMDYYQIFNETNNPQKLKRFVESGIEHLKTLRPKTEIRKMVCIGLGRFNLTNLIPRASTTRDTAMKYQCTKGSHHRVVSSAFHQVIFLDNLIKHLYDMGQPIEHIYFQDPAFTEVEIRFLKRLGFEVLQDPQAQIQTTRNTLLYNPATEPFLISECVKSNKSDYPALYIGIKLEMLYTPTILVPVDDDTRKTLRDYERQTNVAKMELMYGEGWEHNAVIRWLKV